MAKIREDLVGVVSVVGLNLAPGADVPEGVTVGDHVLEPQEKAEPAEDKPAPKRTSRRRAVDSEEE